MFIGAEGRVDIDGHFPPTLQHRRRPLSQGQAQGGERSRYLAAMSGTQLLRNRAGRNTVAFAVMWRTMPVSVIDNPDIFGLAYCLTCFNKKEELSSNKVILLSEVKLSQLQWYAAVFILEMNKMRAE